MTTRTREAGTTTTTRTIRLTLVKSERTLVKDKSTPGVEILVFRGGVVDVEGLFRSLQKDKTIKDLNTAIKRLLRSLLKI